MQSRKFGGFYTGPLVAYWEVALDPISDNYTPEEISAEDLFWKWEGKARERYPDGLVPIYWFVLGNQHSEAMPFQYPFPELRQFAPTENLLTYFTWPEDASTGQPINWARDLMVVDKLWRQGYAEKGGFIQEYTTWKPSILQPYVYLGALGSICPG